MFQSLFRRSRTRRPLLGIIVFTVFFAIALSLISRWNQVGTDAEAGATNVGPTVVDSIRQWEDYTVIVEGRPVQISALRDERMQIVNVQQAPIEPVAKDEPQITTTQAPPATEEDVVEAPSETNMGTAADQQVVATLIPTSTPQPQPVQVQVTNNPNQGVIGFQAHMVQPGETLFRLTQIYPSTNYDMLARHGIYESSMVTGAVLQVPYANGAACSSGKACPIARGDTLFSLARLHGTTVQTLQQLNGIGPDFAISAGGAICVP